MVEKRRDTWVAEIMVERRKIHLGEFAEKYDAIIARKQAERKYFGEFQHV